MKWGWTTATLAPSAYDPRLAARARRRSLVWKQRGVVAALVTSDVLLALFIWQAASIGQDIWGRGELTVVSNAAIVPIIAMWVGTRALLGLYPGYGLDAVEELRRHTYATLAALAMLVVFAWTLQVGYLLSRLLLALVFLGLLLLAPFVRPLIRRVLKRMKVWGKPVVVFSYNEVKTNFVGLLKQNWQLGYDPTAHFDCPLFDHRLATSNVRFMSENDQQALVRAVEPTFERSEETIIFAMPYTRREQLARLVSLASGHFRHVLIIPNVGGMTSSAVAARSLPGTFAVEAKYNLLDPWALRVKRLLDLVATVIGGILILPLFLVIALLVYLESGRPVFYSDWRMGRDGTDFSCIKFRTMVPEAENRLQTILEKDGALRDEYSRYHKLRDDPRITRIGRLLRKTSLDELPQLWSVLKGEMSLVGPRPYLLRESKEIGMTQSEILRVRPGITGPWQVAGRNKYSFHARVQMDAHYVRDWSVWLDLVLLARTVKTVLWRRGAF